MNDTHGQQGEGWIGFDLDGTLAKYDGWKGFDHIGEPVKPMVALVKKLHAEGRRVKVLTARVAPHKLEDGTTGEAYITVPGEDGGSTRQYARQYVADWCHFNLGFVPEITHEKDHLMLDLYDDRCHQVVPNTGEIVEEQRDAARRDNDRLRGTVSGLAAGSGKTRWLKELLHGILNPLTLLAANVPSLVFLAACLWCLHTNHPVCAGWLLAFSILTHAYVGKERSDD